MSNSEKTKLWFICTSPETLSILKFHRAVQDEITEASLETIFTDRPEEIAAKRNDLIIAILDSNYCNKDHQFWRNFNLTLHLSIPNNNLVLVEESVFKKCMENGDAIQRTLEAIRKLRYSKLQPFPLA